MTRKRFIMLIVNAALIATVLFAGGAPRWYQWQYYVLIIACITLAVANYTDGLSRKL